MADYKIRKRTTAAGAKRYLAEIKGPDGRWISAGTWPSERVAQTAALKALLKVEEGVYVDPRSGRVTFKEYVEQVWMPGRIGVIEHNSMQRDRSFLKNHLMPVFGDMPLAKILPSTVQTWIARMSKAGQLSPSSISSAYVLLSSILKSATADGNIARNPAIGVKLPTVPTPEVVVISPEQFNAFLIALRPDRRLMAEVAIETGMRWGEVIALCPAQIDFLRRTITIDRAVTETTKTATGTGSPFERKAYPKGKRPRVVRVGQDLIDGLAAVMAVKELDAKSTAELFVTSRGTFLGRSDNAATVRSAMRAAGVPDNVSWKHLRSSHASWALAGGADLIAVKDRLGHRDISTTQKYLSALPEADERALHAFDSVRGRPQVPPANAAPSDLARAGGSSRRSAS